MTALTRSPLRFGAVALGALVLTALAGLGAVSAQSGSEDPTGTTTETQIPQATPTTPGQESATPDTSDTPDKSTTPDDGSTSGDDKGERTGDDCDRHGNSGTKSDDAGDGTETSGARGWSRSNDGRPVA